VVSCNMYILCIMYRKYGNKFYCFSPPVMLATFFIEFSLLFYTIWRYKMTTLTRLAAVFLGALGTFQLAEYMICGGLGLDHVGWVQLGYSAITLLPALGLHMTSVIANKKITPVLVAAYATTVAYVAYFVIVGPTVITHQCAPNYAIFNLSGNGYFYYGMFYYGWLFVTIALATIWSRQTPKKALALRWMAMGYAVFIIPTTYANLVNPATISAIPSIMCGFAVLCALILTGRVFPLAKVPVIREFQGARQRRV
jgi:hypothetical protein